MRPLRAIFCALCLLGPASAASGGGTGSELMEYDITWIGVSVGTMTVRSGTDGAGALLRSIRIWNRPWIAMVYAVDNTIECRIESTPDGPRHTVAKKMGERDFAQDDTLELWPDAGRAVWSNAVSNTVHAFEVPKGSKDFVSFFFDLREAARGERLNAGGEYRLVMDGALHALEIKTGPAELLRTPQGREEAIPVRALSKSPALFSRNRPRSVWISATQPVVLSADVQTGFGAVRATLVRWEVDGQPVERATSPGAR